MNSTCVRVCLVNVDNSQTSAHPSSGSMCFDSFHLFFIYVLHIYTKDVCRNWMFLGDFPMHWGQYTSNPFTVFCSQGCLGISKFWNQYVMVDSRTQRKFECQVSILRLQHCDVTCWQTEQREQVPIKAKPRQEMRKTCKKVAAHGGTNGRSASLCAIK